MHPATEAAMPAGSATPSVPPPLPAGFAVSFDHASRETTPGTFLGGHPMRRLRVLDSGAAALAELREGPIRTTAAGRLARRLIDAGIAHPVPPVPAGTAAQVTVVVPVYERADALARCLAALNCDCPVIVVDDGSADAVTIAQVAAQRGARLIRLPHNQGPAAARNAGLAEVRTPLVAFCDSDTEPDGDWIPALAPHLADPLVAAVAPRVVPSGGRGWWGAYLRDRGALDLGARPCGVRPYAPVSYLPTAALLARTDALRAVARDGAVFDPALRVGEDVDLVWRLVAAGARVRYQPECSVVHAEPETARALLARRFRYGTSAAALSARHRDNLAPMVVHRWFTTAAVAALAGRPVLALAASGAALTRTVAAMRVAELPAREAPRATARGLGQTWLGLGRYVTQFAAPLLLAGMCTGPRRRRVAATVLLAGPPLHSWATGSRGLDPARFTLAATIDDAAYGAGVLIGCLRARTLRPLVPLTSKRIGRI